MASFSPFWVADWVAFVNAKRASQKRGGIVGSFEHHKLAGADLTGNRRTIDPKEKID